MLYHIANNWRRLVLRGVIAIACGVMALLRPRLTMEGLILLFTIDAILIGALLAYLGLCLRRVIL